MDEDQNALAEQISGDDEDVENGGVGPGDAEEQGSSEADQGIADTDENYTQKMQKRVHQQARKHAREMRQMQEQLMQMQAQLGGDSTVSNSQYNSNPYPSPGQPNPPAMSEQDKIQHAVRLALGEMNQQEKQAKEAERVAHVHKQYQRLNDEFDRASEKYDDFDDVVRESDAPFTDHVRDALLLVENPAEVAYRLGKNKSELERISRLHPIDQAREVNKLSFSLMGGTNGKTSSPTKANPLGTVRANPAHSSNAITDKTPPSVIRQRMKAGTWK